MIAPASRWRGSSPTSATNQQAVTPSPPADKPRKVTRSISVWRPTVLLALPGAAAFWVVNFAISLTPLAAEYRAALSIAYAPMLVEAAVGGLFIAVFVSWVMMLSPGWIATRNPLAKSLVISFVVLLTLTAVIDIPAKFFTSSVNDPWRYFLIAIAFNALRILALGVAVGYGWSRHIKGARQ
ncbi:hypothetical protein GCM10009841_20010 [Microlunatus panaciterrae]|uniref:DUF4149 domain-containing protein n=1 Tax=Microlunatus panaciterrae TaxID=400768 RepID=A0ABS2RNF7_9ACTN|nr:hypothetical protein [Microlunatus panaciterrae]MBM7800555.1 hypothetical protein [Microlunatus panaciterrae]